MLQCYIKNTNIDYNKSSKIEIDIRIYSHTGGIFMLLASTPISVYGFNVWTKIELPQT
jgi:hypothetical protein